MPIICFAHLRRVEVEVANIVAEFFLLKRKVFFKVFEEGGQD